LLLRRFGLRLLALARLARRVQSGAARRNRRRPVRTELAAPWDRVAAADARALAFCHMHLALGGNHRYIRAMALSRTSSLLLSRAAGLRALALLRPARS